jgi:hypothetical protein
MCRLESDLKKTVTTHTELYHLDHKKLEFTAAGVMNNVYRTVLAGKCIGFVILTYVGVLW